MAAGHSFAGLRGGRRRCNPFVEKARACCSISSRRGARGRFHFFQRHRDSRCGSGVARCPVPFTAPEGKALCDFFHHRRRRHTAHCAVVCRTRYRIHGLPGVGGTKAAEAGTLTILVGGKHPKLARVRPLWKSSAKTFSHGRCWLRQVTKACNQTAQVIAIQGIAGKRCSSLAPTASMATRWWRR